MTNLKNALAIIILCALIFSLNALVVMGAWNWGLVPTLGIPQIDFWPAAFIGAGVELFKTRWGSPSR
jgi:hypothetical protein